MSDQQQGYQAPPQQGYQAPPQQGYQAPPQQDQQQGYQAPPQQGYQQQGDQAPPQQGYQAPPQQDYGAIGDAEAGDIGLLNGQKKSSSKTIFSILAGLVVLGGAGVLVWYFATHTAASGGGGVVDTGDSLNFTALGDWGTSPDTEHQSSTQKDNCQWQQHDKWNQACWKDFNAQMNLGWLMGKWADGKDISFVLSQGDNMYWDGVKTSTDPRWNTTFEDVYNYSSLAVPWLAVMGNHDYGGGSDYAGGGTKAMDTLFNAQKNYVSHVKGREWHLDHYFKKTFTHTNKDGTTFDVDVFNIDTNVAETHGYNEICCQIYPLGHNWPGCDDDACRALDTYSAKMGCDSNLDNIVQCRAYLEKQYQDSVKQLSIDLAASTAKWKIVNSHYHPRMHMPKHEDSLNAVLKAGKVNAVFCGHTHAEGHDYNENTKTHFFLNGAGGGIRLSGDDDATKDTIMKTFTQYAFIGVHASKDAMKVVFWGYDLSKGGGWTDWSKTKSGKAAIYHCWNLPEDGGTGSNCTQTEYEVLTAEMNDKKF